MRTRACVLLAVLASGLAAPCWAAAVDDNPWGSSTPYEDCLDSINRKADDAFELALTWRDHGGGLPAEHCAALALMALDEPGEAASRLDGLARRMDAGNLAQRAQLLDQSGDAWIEANEADNAVAAFSAALKLTPRDAGLWTDRARAYAAKEDWVRAESDLNNALTFDKTHPETYVLRAAARSAQGNKAGYKTDIDAALKLDPGFPEALLERGLIRLAARDVAGARADWLQVIVKAPDSAAGDAARDHIQDLEVHDK